ncbi:hypothetical protein LNKW23_36330 [Paralimibaculum aggregatum]|uniref:Lipoprotein n=1 Tax=Paralimibaculum aggregatum TaxID=3036245 RepID=A0ABQ6LN43_9RHOB|nr:hypothetical protein [Limibaculum sp. NKW23]GMG84417.1 hypothetical protein LNKW23_36330 [Limibaculum sp. NKW23]
MKRRLAIASLTCLAACSPPPPGASSVTGVSSVAGPGGAPPNRVRRSRAPDACCAAASRTCGGGSHQVPGSASHAGGLLADVLPGPVTWYGMTFACGPSDGRPAGFPPRGAAQRAPGFATCNTIGNSTNCVQF